jgi:hypothetical protein
LVPVDKRCRDLEMVKAQQTRPDQTRPDQTKPNHTAPYQVGCRSDPAAFLLDWVQRKGFGVYGTPPWVKKNDRGTISGVKNQLSRLIASPSPTKEFKHRIGSDNMELKTRN